MMKTRALISIVLLIVSTASVGAGAIRSEVDARLVVCIVVDGLRYDTLHQAYERFGTGGFRRLLKDGLEYRQAHYKHSSTFTAVGHATMLTGTYPPHHGIVGNYWYDPTSGERVYAVGDPEHPIIGQPPGSDTGRSPAHLMSTTVGDELVLASGRRSRVFSVSGKDRAAIFPGGHLGQAYWYDKRTGHFVTSTYYRQQYPEWVEAWNQADPADRYRETSWTLLRRADEYLNSEDDRPGEKGYKHLGRTFPHRLQDGEAADFYAVLRYTPYADELLLAFVKELVTREQLGRRDVVDLLAVSFSAMDYIQHGWGVRSREAEDNLLRVDLALAELLSFLDEAVGLDKTLVVLTADHGFDDIPEEWQRLGFSAGRHRPKQLVSRVNAALRERFHTTEDLVFAFWPPSLYLNPKAVGKLGVDVQVVERALAEIVLRQPGIAFAAPRSDLLAGRLPDDSVHRRVQMAFHPQRSGNVLVVQEQFWYLYTTPDVDAATHGSPYHYDTHVPLIVAGPGVRSGVVQRSVGPEEIAPTISTYLGIAAPSSSVSTTLVEVLEQ
jgi:predicted AlkP superfamily pyrophosphatase or phosphodiesterase